MKILDPNDPKRLDGLTPQQLIEEIGQIATQYLKEVPSNGRVAWPESIRARVLALARLGVPRKKIAELTPVPAATAKFHPTGTTRFQMLGTMRFHESGTTRFHASGTT